MEILKPNASLAPDSIVCLGAFDGMHRGHQELLRRTLVPGFRSALATFSTHPVEVIAPDRAPARLQTNAQRERVCAQLGADQLAYLPFDSDIAALSPIEFVTRFLLEQLQPRRVVVGDDFRFGARRAGDANFLRELLAGHEIPVEIVPEQCIDAGPLAGQRLGSTLARQCVANSDFDGVRAILGRHYCVSATVVPGDQRGRTIGFPTANLVPSQLLPTTGVYAGWSTRAGVEGAVPAVANLGQNPTFGDADATRLEVHLLESFSDASSLYGEELEFHFVQRLRPEKRFANTDALIAAIRADIVRARALLDAKSRAAIGVATLVATTPG